MELNRGVTGERSRSGPSPPRQRRCTIGGGDLAPGAARRAFDNFINGELSDRQRTDARLLVTEIATNSVRHAGAGPEDSIELTLSISSSAVRVAILDHGDGFAPAASTRAKDGTREGGRGLFLLDALADRWGVEREGATSVWFEMSRGRRSDNGASPPLI
jgi:anti-sigma regulatory factor (Ser/Thr protein kinase)